MRLENRKPEDQLVSTEVSVLARADGGFDLVLMVKSVLNFRPIYIYIFKFIFIFGCVGSLLLCTGFSLVAASRGYSSLQCGGFSLGGFSCCKARALGAWASVVVALGLSSCGSWALERRLSSCGARA